MPGAVSWLPPRKRFDCAYVARPVTIKPTYRLWVTAAEKAALSPSPHHCAGSLNPPPSASPP